MFANMAEESTTSLTAQRMHANIARSWFYASHEIRETMLSINTLLSVNKRNCQDKPH